MVECFCASLGHALHTVQNLLIHLNITAEPEDLGHTRTQPQNWPHTA